MIQNLRGLGEIQLPSRVDPPRDLPFQRGLVSGFLLDTNVLSEAAKPKPNALVIHFLQGLGEAYISVLSIHELFYGIDLLPSGSRRRITLTDTIEALLMTFQDSILSIGPSEARTAAQLRASAQQRGRTLHVIDTLIAATALRHGLTIATRNINDFKDLGVTLKNPWVA